MPIPLEIAVATAREAGVLLHEHFIGERTVNEFAAHDIKLELDVRAQDLIENRLLAAFPEHAFLGEEGSTGQTDSEFQWIVDPLDGTVNYFYGIPHFCVSIGLRRGQELILGVIYDPMRDELWQAERGGGAWLNGRRVEVSKRDNPGDAVVTIGFAKSGATINAGLPLLERLVHKVRKCRMMGSAALDMAYVATGRLDAYIEQGISLWDMAAGWVIVEEAGGKMEVTERADAPGKYSVAASSGRIDFTSL